VVTLDPKISGHGVCWCGESVNCKFDAYLNRTTQGRSHVLYSRIVTLPHTVVCPLICCIMYVLREVRKWNPTILTP